MFAETLEDFALKHSDLIVQSARNGNERAFSQLMNIWYKRIYNFCYKYFGDHDIAMEATQRTFISAHKGIKGLNEPASFTSWIYRIASNNCHEEERKNKKRSWLSIFNREDDEDDKLMSLHHHTNDEFYNPDSAVERKEMQVVITNCLNKIPAEQRTVVILKEYEGLKFREIAMALQISENTAKSRLYYGLNAMRKQLESRNIYKENAYGN
jgi:RNA polymerase sigma-70 factor (ECF subfamily)